MPHPHHGIPQIALAFSTYALRPSSYSYDTNLFLGLSEPTGTQSTL